MVNGFSVQNYQNYLFNFVKFLNRFVANVVVIPVFDVVVIFILVMRGIPIAVVVYVRFYH